MSHTVLKRVLALGVAAAAASACAPAGTTGNAAAAISAPAREYTVYVASEATDRIARVQFGPEGARLDHEITTGVNLIDPDGPHGVGISPDGRFYYVSTAHGVPYGYLWKYAAEDDALVGRTMLGNFPATLQISPDGAYAYVANFNLHGEMVPSSVSVVSTDEMVEIARIATCTMPHGSRLNAQGTKHYSACMMDDLLVEIDTRTLGVSRYFHVAPGREHGMAGAPNAPASSEHTMNAMHDAQLHAAAAPACSPTWAQPSADGTRIYVACNKTNDIVEIDAERWALVRRIPAGEGVYNLAVTRDGRLLIGTNKRGQSVSIFDTATGDELARIPTTRKVVHGVAVSPDDRYAFVSVEGIGSEPGTVEIIDLRALQRIASVDVGQMAGGIDVVPAAARP
jgi:DNA-binding beta-propeller fold protein YncE